MAASESVNSADLLREQVESALPDVADDGEDVRAGVDVRRGGRDLRCTVRTAQRGAGQLPQRLPGREWDTRAGTIDLAVPKLRTGSYFPDWLLTHRRRAEQALVSVVATSYLLGVSTRRVEKLVEQLGIRQLPKSQVSEMAAHLDAQVEAFRNRPLDTGPYTFVWMDALTTGQRSSTSSTGRHDRWESHPDEQWHADGRVRRSPAARDHHRGPGHGRIVFATNRAYNVATMCACCKYTMDAIDGYVTNRNGRDVVVCIDWCGGHDDACVTL